ncbi:high mobility group B protein 10-like [Senna tora]|uniref:High mobility group B protein 10-like n=1 Tax=Senna tora TaxID=362788 RepID=A0A834T3F6_9FABA|nr:high mobility group B protein 10-like [Senna tora]
MKLRTWSEEILSSFFFRHANNVSPVEQLGSLVPGTIDMKFDGGYVVTVDLGSEQLKGILYHVPLNVSQSSYTASTTTSQNRKRSRLGLRDPSRPKSNRSGYNFFFAENYARLKPSYFGQERAISKKIGFLWNHLTEAERQIYQEKGRRDKERYKTQMLEYKSSNNSTPQ